MPISFDALKDRQREAPDWIITGYLKRQNTAIIMGPPKRSGKSWMILDACWSLSEGKNVWDVPSLGTPRPLRCVYFTQEDCEDDIQDRVLAHVQAGRPTSDRLWVVPKNLSICFDSTVGRNLIQHELDQVVEKAGPIDLVCFDPMRRMHHGDENDSRTITEIWGVLDRIHQRYKCATLIAHHTIKPPRDLTNYDPTDPHTGRGSGDIYGGGDAFMVVIPGTINGQSRQVSVFFESKRGKLIEPARLKISFSSGHVAYMGTAIAPETTTL